MAAFHDFVELNVKTQSDPDIYIHGIQSHPIYAEKPAILLLHGFPQNYRIWRHVAPHLTSRYNVIAMDLRGYGASSKPSEVSAYRKSAMATDCIHVMSFLGFESFFVCAHDRGARVAHKLCVDFPKAIRKAIFLDICPTLAMYTKTDFEFARSYFHWFFLIQKYPLPEDAISAKPNTFAANFMGGRQAGGMNIFDQDGLQSYVRGLGNYATIHAMCQEYRASSTLDLEEARHDLSISRLLQCPLRVLWARHGVIERCFDALDEWRQVSQPGLEVTGHSVDSGHYLPEQAHEEVVTEILEFLA